MTNELAKQLYDSEWSRREQFVAAVAVPISIVTGLGGGVVILGQSFVLDASFVTRVFAFLGVCSLGFLSAAVYTLVRSYHGYDYQQIPGPAALQKYYQELASYYSANPTQAELEFKSYLCDRYIEAAEQNAHSNSSRSAYLYQTMRSIVLALITTALLVIPWTVNTMDREPEPQRIVIVPSR